MANELKHYIEYGIWLEKETMTWRNTQIDCFFDDADGGCLAFEWMGLTCYDKYVVSAGEVPESMILFFIHPRGKPGEVAEVRRKHFIA